MHAQGCWLIYTSPKKDLKKAFLFTQSPSENFWTPSTKFWNPLHKSLQPLQQPPPQNPAPPFLNFPTPLLILATPFMYFFIILHTNKFLGNPLWQNSPTPRTKFSYPSNKISTPRTKFSYPLQNISHPPLEYLATPSPIFWKGFPTKRLRQIFRFFHLILQAL